MSLFETYDQDPKGDDPEKSRLFDTLKDEGRSVKDYLKVLVPVVAAVLVIGGLVVFFTMPGLGDEVRPPQMLDDAVRAFYLDSDKRAVETVTYFYCNDFYAARVKLETRKDVTARQFDHGGRRAVAIEAPNGGWQIASNIIAPDETFEPCRR